MRHSSLWATLAVLAALFAAGCGGSGGNSRATVNGIWTGSFTQAIAVGDTNTLQAEFFQNGAAITGTMVSLTPASAAITALTGKVEGDQLTAAGTDTSGSQLSLVGTVRSAGITGTYTLTSASTSQSGAFTLTKSIGVTTPDLSKLALEWGGQFDPASGLTHWLGMRFAQNRNTLSFTGTTGLGFTDPPTTITGTGAVIGNNVTLLSTGLNATTTYFLGTYKTPVSVISGTYRDGLGNTGVFDLLPPQ